MLPLSSGCKSDDLFIRRRGSKLPIGVRVLRPHKLAIVSENHLRTVSHFEADSCCIVTLLQPICPIAVPHCVLRPSLKTRPRLHRIEAFAKSCGCHCPAKLRERTDPSRKVSGNWHVPPLGCLRFGGS